MKTWTALTLFLALSWPSAVMAQELETPERFQGIIIDAGGAVPRRSTAPFTLVIEKYSTVEEINSLIGVLAEGGQNALEKAMFKLDNGYIKIGASTGYPISITRSLDVDGGRIIRAVTDRPIQMFEVRRNLRSLEHSLGIIEIELPAGAKKGTGQLIAAAKVSLRENGSIEIESLGTQPFRLSNVTLKADKKKKKK